MSLVLSSRLHQTWPAAVFVWISLLLAPQIAGATDAGCVNESSRALLSSAQLPDCRAYEMVTPASKNAWRVERPYVAGDGSRVLAVSLGGFAGSSQASFNNLYIFTRTPGIWDAAPFVEPSGYANATVENLQASREDLSEGLFEYRRSPVADLREPSFYRRSLPDGSPVEIGRLFSPEALASNPVNQEPSASEPSASQDLTHVLYTIDGPNSLNGPRIDYLWPGDETVEHPNEQPWVSLYEYVGTGNAAPVLVGRDSSGHQISQCGTALGYPFRGRFTRFSDDELYNAISIDASRVFFTAAAVCEGGAGPPANELLLRVNQEKTISISQPSHPLAQGSGSGSEECDTSCEAAAPKEGIFQGASERGSRVFFLTAQPLLNGDQNAERDLYEAEIEGEGVNTRLRKLVLVSGDPNIGEAAEVQGVARISEDGTHVYFVAKGVLTSAKNPIGRPAQLGADNIYVYERDTHYPNGHTAFIATLSEADEADWRREDARPVDATPDGSSVIFTSTADLTLDDTSSVPQVFQYNAHEDTLVRVSIGQGGFNVDGNTGEYPASIAFPEYTGSLSPAHRPTSISDDGAYVVFQSSDNLTPQAAAGYHNVYEYHNGRVSLISDGQDRTVDSEGTSSTSLIGVDASGEDVFFMTADQLVPQDGDTQVDVYDARMDGGVLPSLSAGCEGDGCQGALAPVLPLETTGSVSQPPGDQATEPPVKPGNKPKVRRAKKAKAKKHAKKSRHRTSGPARRGLRR